MGARFFAPVQRCPGTHSGSYTMGTGPLFPDVKRPGRGLNHPPKFNAEVKERVELYSPSGFSWLVLRRTFLTAMANTEPQPLIHTWHKYLCMLHVLVGFSEHTTIISLPRIVFSVRYELYLYIQSRLFLVLQPFHESGVTRWPLTTEALIRSQTSPCKICGGQSGAGTRSSPSTSVFPCQYHSAVAVYSSESACCCYQKDKRAKPGNLPKSSALSETGERWTKK